MKDWLLRDWAYGSPKRSYARARTNEDRAGRAAEAEIRRTLAALCGEENLVIGSIADGTPVRIALDEIGKHAMVWGSSGAGKSYGIHLLTDGWSASGRVLELIDPKGETFLLKALAAAATYEALPKHEREGYAARFAVRDVLPIRMTPDNLWHVPAGMSPALLASLRAAAVAETSNHAFSDLMAYGIYLLYAVVINLGWGVTVRIVREFYLNAAFRARVARLLTDPRLRDSVENIETTLPEQTRKAIVRQFDLLLAATPARISFGLSPTITTALRPASLDTATIRLGNFGPTPQRPPALGKAMATNRLVDVLSEAAVRADSRPELVVLEEVGVLVKHAAVADYLLEASRTLRWKGVGIVCVAQDPANAIPKGTATALLLNAKWLLAFESGREEALWLEPHMPVKAEGETDGRRRFIAEMAKLPTQEAVFVRKGLPGFRLRLADVQVPTDRTSRERLMEVFETKIAARSMVETARAEDAISRFEAELFAATVPPIHASPLRADAPKASPGSMGEFFEMLNRARGGTKDG